MMQLASRCRSQWQFPLPCDVNVLLVRCAVGSPRPKRWNASSARSSLASEQTGVEPGGPNELPKFPLPEMFGFLDEDG